MSDEQQQPEPEDPQDDDRGEYLATCKFCGRKFYSKDAMVISHYVIFDQNTKQTVVAAPKILCLECNVELFPEAVLENFKVALTAAKSQIKVFHNLPNAERFFRQ